MIREAWLFRMKNGRILTMGIIFTICLMMIGCAEEVVVDMPSNPEEAVERLQFQNERYIEANENDGDISAALREETVEDGQSPYAVVLTCSDSRVVPEHIFMEGIGALFTIRNAGNIVDNNVIGSVEYGVEHLDAKVVLVLGHTECGAVHATLEDAGHDYIQGITDEIASGIGEETDPREAEILNVQHSLDTLMESEIVIEAVENGTIILMGGIYDTTTGAVEFW